MELTKEDQKLRDAFDLKLERDILSGRRSKSDVKGIKDEARALIRNEDFSFRNYMQTFLDGEADQ